MENIVVRDARQDEAGFIVEMIRLMVTDMANHGGHAPATDGTAWENMSVSFAAELQRHDCKYVIAEAANRDRIGVAGAEQRTLGGAFAPKKVMHINVVYVLPRARCHGIGETLIATILDWGRSIGSEQCDLNVLSKNPARVLYEKFGFATVEIKMMCSL